MTGSTSLPADAPNSIKGYSACWLGKVSKRRWRRNKTLQDSCNRRFPISQISSRITTTFSFSLTRSWTAWSCQYPWCCHSSLTTCKARWLMAYSVPPSCTLDWPKTDHVLRTERRLADCKLSHRKMCLNLSFSSPKYSPSAIQLLSPKQDFLFLLWRWSSILLPK